LQRKAGSLSHKQLSSPWRNVWSVFKDDDKPLASRKKSYGSPDVAVPFRTWMTGLQSKFSGMMRGGSQAMVIDSSVLISILLGEAETIVFSRAVAGDPKRLVSVFSVLETSIVIEAKKGEAGGRELDLLLHRAQIQPVSLTEEQMELAQRAWRKYGKGRHPAGLNIGDCCSYALSKHSGEPLLYKGEDFIQTDIESVQVSQDRSL
jgi:ribonuclease VapC